MAYVPVAKPSVGDATFKTAFADGIIDNQTYFNTMIGTSAIGASLVPNGSFEDVTAGVPDGWTGVSESGTVQSSDGAGALIDPAHGDYCYQMISSGAPGGGYLQTTDHFPVSEIKNVVVDFLLYSTVADIHNLVELRWYGSDNAEVDYISSSAVYDDATTNPVTTWTRFIGSATPDTGALWAKLRLTGAKNDDTTAGTCAFDGVSVTESPTGYQYGEIAEWASSATGWGTRGTDTIVLPTLSADCVVRLQLTAEGKITVPNAGYIRFNIGSFYSNTQYQALTTSYVAFTFEITLLGISGSQTLNMQSITDASTVTGKLSSRIQVDVFRP